GALAGLDVDGYGAVQGRDADRRNTGDEPARRDTRAPAIGQVTRGAADIDAAQPWRWHGWLPAAAVEQGQAIGDAEEQRRGAADADEGGIRPRVEVADPDHQYVRADHAGAPGVVEAPGGAGLPGHRPGCVARVGG